MLWFRNHGHSIARQLWNVNTKIEISQFSFSTGIDFSQPVYYTCTRT
nr:MAG TPA: hypothetical protein [Caudoviricetes sp.]